jgi:hypothetical protein
MLLPNGGAAEGIAFNRADFQLPVSIRGDLTRIKSLIVWVSTDEGKSWSAVPGSPFPANIQHIDYVAPNDGIYYFSISAVDLEGRQNPNDPSQLKVMQRVLVDRQAPAMHITDLDRTDTGISVKWDVKEDHPASESFKVFYQVHGSNEWIPVMGVDVNAGQAFFKPNGEVSKVRIEMLDVANNQGHDERGLLPVGPPVVSGPGRADRNDAIPPTQPTPPIVPVMREVPRGGWNDPTPMPAPSHLDPGVHQIATSSNQPGITPPPSTPPGSSMTEMKAPAPSQLPPVKYVNSRRVNLKYKVVQYGLSGIAGVELYLTRDDGRTWMRYTGEQNISSPAAPDPHSNGPLQQTLTFDLPGDGLYGVYVVLQSGSGYKSEPAPRSGQAPQVRLMVDVTPPVVDLFKLEPDTGKRDTVVITWRGVEANPGPTPILLEWAEQESGEWHMIGPGELPNSGSFTWSVPSNVPPRVYLRVTMRDLAGNVAVAQTSEPQDLDLRPPKIESVDVEGVPEPRRQ